MYEGKVVWAERVDPKQTYYNGEYIIVMESPTMLYGVATVSGPGYNAHDLRKLPKVGNEAFKIIHERRDDKYVREFADGLMEFSRSTKRNWIDSVYDGARANAKKIYDVLGESVDTSPSAKEKQVKAATEQVKEILMRFVKLSTDNYGKSNFGMTHSLDYVANVIVNEMNVQPKSKTERLNKIFVTSTLIKDAVSGDEKIAVSKSDFDFILSEARKNAEGQ